MSIVRFISDYHFGDKFTTRLRGFESVEDINNHIIETHNKIVKRKDLTYILGDISMEKPEYYPLLDLMNGRKIIILGNHDLPKHTRNLLQYCETVAGMIKYKSVHGKFFLTHAPMIEAKEEAKNKIKNNIHGHVHSNSIDDSWYINVSCEVIDYAPKTIEELLNL